jgi:hypothetical protein
MLDAQVFVMLVVLELTFIRLLELTFIRLHRGVHNRARGRHCKIAVGA